MWAVLAPVERRTGGRRGANGVSYRDDRSSFMDELAAPPIDEAEELIDSLLQLDSADGYKPETTAAAGYRAASQRYRDRQRYAYVAPIKGYPRGKWPRNPNRVARHHNAGAPGPRLYRENPSLPYLHLKYLDLLGPPVPGYREMPPWVDYDKQRSPAMPPRTKAGKQAKVHKVMKEFQSGTLRSGSSTGPKVQSRKQAQAIALSEAGLSKKKKK
jgi:hypothetical protein